MCYNRELSGINCEANAHAVDHCQVKLEKTTGLYTLLPGDTDGVTRVPIRAARIIPIGSIRECALYGGFHSKRVTLECAVNSLTTQRFP